MTLKTEDEKLIRRYLLGQLDEEEQLRLEVEERLFNEADFSQHIQIVESELIADYVRGALNREDKDNFEKYFRPTPDRLQQFQLSMSLSEYSGTAVPDVELQERQTEYSWYTSIKSLFTPRLQLVVYTVLALALGVGLYRLYFYKSNIDKGLSALNRAYEAGRPVESRITGFEFAPFRQLQGPEEQEIIDRPALDLSANLLLNAATENPNAVSLHALGCYYLFRKEFTEAIKQFKGAVEKEPNNARFHNDLGAALFEKGKQEIRDEKGGQEQVSEAQEQFNKAVELNDSLLEALFNRSLCYHYQKLYSQAEQSWQQYLQKDSQSKWADEARQNLKIIDEGKRRKASLKDNIYSEFLAAYRVENRASAWTSFNLGRVRGGNLIIERLIDGFLDPSNQDRVQDVKAQLSALAFAAAVERQTSGDCFTEDITNFYRSSSIVQKRESYKARQMIKTANELYSKSNFEAAHKMYSDASLKFSTMGNQAEALMAESWSGFCLLRIPEVDQSLDLFIRLSKELKKKKYFYLQAQALNAIADAYTNKAEFSKTLEYAERSYEFSDLIGDRPMMLRNLLSFVSTNLALGKYEEVLDLTHRALKMADELVTNPVQVWPFYHEAAMAHFNLNHYAAALDFQKEAVILADESQMPLLKSRAHARIGLIYERLQNYQSALSHGLSALNEANNISGDQMKSNLIANSSMQLGDVYLQLGDTNHAIRYYDHAISVYEKRNAPDYLYRNHKGKLLAYLKANKKDYAHSELEITLRLFEEFRPKILEESNRNKFFDVGHDIYDVAMDFAFTELNDSEKAFNYSEASRARTLLDLSHTKVKEIEGKVMPTLKLPASITTPIPLSTIRQRLPENIQLLEYAVLDSKLLGWLITKSTFYSFCEEIADEDLEILTRSYLATLRSDDEQGSNLAKKYSKRLYRILLSKVATYLQPEKPLYIVPDKILNRLPFAALLLPATKDKPERYLIQDFPLAISPSANLLLVSTDFARSKDKSKIERILCIGNPKFDTGLFDLSDLPSSKTEAEMISTNYGSAVVLTGNNVTKDLVKEEMQRADILHISTHAVIGEDSHLQSKLLLAKDSSSSAYNSSLHAFEIYQMSLPYARLAVLSACQTAVEQPYRGEGAIGLARPFISLGVPLVVASLWQVDSTPTSRLMVGFHQYRTRNGLTTVDALRRAQLEMVFSNVTSHRQPLHWSSFVVVGGYANF